MSAADYARRFARWARERRAAMSNVYRCAECGTAGGELTESNGRLLCSKCSAPRLLTSSSGSPSHPSA